jgi:hypothetical protein
MHHTFEEVSFPQRETEKTDKRADEKWKRESAPRENTFVRAIGRERQVRARITNAVE